MTDNREDRNDILAARAADAMARLVSVAKGKDMSEWEDESGSRVSQTTIEVRVIERLERLQSEIERLRGVLQHIAHMECYTRDGEEEPHLLMMRLAQEVLNV